MPTRKPLISEKQIERALNMLNEASGNPVDCLDRDGNWAAGCFVFSTQMGRYALERVPIGSTGNFTNIAPYGSRRELYERVLAMIDGINLVKPPLG